MKLTINLSSALLYLLIISLFFGSFVFQYGALFIFIVSLLFFFQFKFKINYTTYTCLFLLFIALISFIYNSIFTGLSDSYSFLFWIFGYLPNFVLIIAILTIKDKVNFEKHFNFYKSIVFIQSLLCIFDAIRYQKLIVGDLASGTLGDANFLAFHFCVIILYEVVHFFTRNITSTSKKKNYVKILEIFYWLVILLIPESTANLGFLLISMALYFMLEIFIKKFSIAKLLLISSIGIIFLVIFVNSFVFVRFQEVYRILEKDKPALQHPYFNKFVIYYKIFSGEIYEDANILIGSGPATFTSRSSIIRIPEIRYNTPPFEVPEFKSPIVDKYVFKIIKQAYLSSYGNFGSPQTSVISVFVELGLIGFLIFCYFFYRIYKHIIHQKKIFPRKTAKLNFLIYFTIFFILNLLFLNIWEYPIYSFTYFLFVFLIL